MKREDAANLTEQDLFKEMCAQVCSNSKRLACRFCFKIAFPCKLTFQMFVLAGNGSEKAFREEI